MRGRGQVLMALLALTAAVVGALATEDLGPRAHGAGADASVVSGAWFCPHGGGEDWGVELVVANPGPAPVDVRVRTLGEGKPSSYRTETIEPSSQLWYPVRAGTEERASVVEYFGGWVAAGWIARGGGVAAEPCLPEAGSSWLVPDGDTEQQRDAYLIVMNPFAADAVVDVTLYRGPHDGDPQTPVVSEKLTHVVVQGERSIAFWLNDVLLGEPAVSARVEAAAGRVAAASLEVVRTGGIRSAVGALGAPGQRILLPGGGDSGQSEVVVMNPTLGKIPFGGTFFGLEDLEPAGPLQDAVQTAESARTYPVVTDGPGAIEVRVRDAGLAAVRRTAGTGSDQGATAGAAPAPAWIVLPTVAGRPSIARLYLANPGDVDASVTLAFLGASAEPFTLTVPAGRTVGISRDFAAEAPRAAVLAVAETGTFVPVSASSSLGKLGLSGYAVSVGVPIPPAFRTG